VVPFFLTFFDFSFRKPVICQDRSEQVSFQKFLKWFGFFCDLAKNQLIPNKYLSKKAPNGSDFFEFFSIFFPAAWVCGESKSENEEKRHLIIENKRLTDLLMSKLHGNVCTRQR